MKPIFIALINLSVMLGWGQNTDTLIIKFRTVPISSGRKMALQSDIATLKEITIKSLKDHYYLKKGTFAGCDSIDIEVNNLNKIVVQSFHYDSTYKYLEEIESFDGIFGKGKEYQYANAEISIRATKWQDRLTAFEMVEVRRKGKIKCYSIMFDKELFLKKKQVGKTTKYLENSFEILRVLNVF
jgi:hypothetical protein